MVIMVGPRTYTRGAARARSRRTRAFARPRNSSLPGDVRMQMSSFRRRLGSGGRSARGATSAKARRCWRRPPRSWCRRAQRRGQSPGPRPRPRRRRAGRSDAEVVPSTRRNRRESSRFHIRSIARPREAAWLSKHRLSRRRPESYRFQTRNPLSDQTTAIPIRAKRRRFRYQDGGVNVWAKEWTDDQAEGRSQRLADGNDLGATLYELSKGGGIAYHFHHGSEELLIVLSGRLKLRTPTGTRDAGSGEVVHFPVGPEGAHGITNEEEGRSSNRLVGHRRPSLFRPVPTLIQRLSAVNGRHARLAPRLVRSSAISSSGPPSLRWCEWRRMVPSRPHVRAMSTSRLTIRSIFALFHVANCTRSILLRALGHHGAPPRGLRAGQDRPHAPADSG